MEPIEIKLPGLYTQSIEVEEDLGILPIYITSQLEIEIVVAARWGIINIEIGPPSLRMPPDDFEQFVRLVGSMRYNERDRYSVMNDQLVYRIRASLAQMFYGIPYENITIRYTDDVLAGHTIRCTSSGGQRISY